MCRAGARWVRENILEANPDLELAVYVVWEPMLGGRRAHAAEAAGLIADPRVAQFWNDEFIAGEYFKEALFGRTAWDIFFLYGNEARWEDEPEPLIRSGYTVYAERERLQEALADLVTP